MGSISLEIALVIVSTVLTVFFMMAESVYITLGDIGIRQISSSRGTKVLNLWFTGTRQLSHTILIGKTLCAVAAIILAYDILQVYFGGSSLALCAVAYAFAYLLLVCFVPWLISAHYAETLATPLMYILRSFYYLLYPLTWLTNVLFSASGKANSLTRTITEDDLAYYIDVSEEQGELKEQKQQMLSNIFDISDIYVKAVMVPRTDMVAVPSDITRDEFLTIIRETEYSRIPVYEDTLDYIKGIIYVKDVIKMGTDWNITNLMEHLHTPLFVPETKKIDDMLREFQRMHQQMAVVVDEYGGVAGIVTMEDVLEQIVGDIWDEYDDDDAEEQDIAEVDTNRYRVDGRTNIEDFCEFFLLERTEDMLDFDTVAGLVYDIAGAIPAVGDCFDWRGFSIEIEQMEDNKIKAVDFIRNVVVEEQQI